MIALKTYEKYFIENDIASDIKTNAYIRIALLAASAVANKKGASNASKTDRPFKEKLDDINKNPQNWEKTNESIVDSTKKGNRGGRSIEIEYTNKVTGEKIYEHTLNDVDGRLIEKPHYRPYPKQ